MVFLDLERKSAVSARFTRASMSHGKTHTAFRNFPSYDFDQWEDGVERKKSLDTKLAGRYTQSFEEEIRESGGLFSRLVLHPQFETFGGFVVLANFIVITMETHATATADDWVLDFVKIANAILLCYYTAELTIRLHVMRMKFFGIGWNTMDFIIVVTGWISALLEAFEVGAGMVDQITILKSLRMLRLLRLVRLFVAFRELYVLIAGIGRCMKTLFWASGLIFIVLNVWAILSVELLNQKVKELIPSGVYQTCSWCDTAFANIWYANMTWFQIISTADWTAIGRPLAEHFWWPYAFFVLIVFLVIWGLLNLIVAAIVDANIAAREDDYAASAKLVEQSYNHAWSSFATICRHMDANGDGTISVQEFNNFVRENNELKQILTVMGIRAEDVQNLLRLMDVDENGSLSCEEFIEQFTMLRTLAEKTSLYLLLRMTQKIVESLTQHRREIQSLHADLSEVKSLCVRAQISSEFDLSNSMLAASQSCRQTSEVCSAGLLAAMRTPGQTPRTTAQSKMLPFGWYYFGASLPPEASVWCKATDPTGELTNAFRVYDDPKEVEVMKDGSGWEPILSNSIPVVRAPSIEPSILHGGATSVRTPRTPTDSPRQNAYGLERFLGKPASDYKSLEHARHVEIESPRCSTLIDEPERHHRNWN